MPGAAFDNREGGDRKLKKEALGGGGSGGASFYTGGGEGVSRGKKQLKRSEAHFAPCGPKEGTGRMKNRELKEVEKDLSKCLLAQKEGKGHGEFEAIPG